jgi:hypothetical protein
VFEWLSNLLANSSSRPARQPLPEPELREPVSEPSPALVRVTKRVMRNGHPEDRRVPIPLLTLEEFFDGNDAVGSIGCNLPSEPTPAAFHALLRKLRERDDVADVLIQITCLDDPGVEWPFSDHIWFITTADQATVRNWFPNDLAPDGVSENPLLVPKYEEVSIPGGHHAVSAWFD